MRRLARGAAKVMFIILIVGLIAATPTIYGGYQLYRDAVDETGISDKVEEIRSRGDYVPLDQISVYFQDEIIRSEDKRFRYHFGVDPLAIARAVKNDLIAGYFAEGGSTITQQLAKNMYFDFDKHLERKVAEVFVAFQLEWHYTKDEILEMYLNCIYFGEDCYGISEAAQHYYQTIPSDLSETEADSLVYTIKCPNLYNPVAMETVTV